MCCASHFRAPPALWLRGGTHESDTSENLMLHGKADPVSSESLRVFRFPRDQREGARVCPGAVELLATSGAMVRNCCVPT